MTSAAFACFNVSRGFGLVACLVLSLLGFVGKATVCLLIDSELLGLVGLGVVRVLLAGRGQRGCALGGFFRLALPHFSGDCLGNFERCIACCYF